MFREKIMENQDLPKELNQITGPMKIDRFYPESGYPGTMVEITGDQFSLTRHMISVSIGGQDATVVETSDHMIKAIVGHNAKSGPVIVRSGNLAVTAEHDFTILKYPEPFELESGLPIFYNGKWKPTTTHIRTLGEIKVLVVFLIPSDLVSVANSLDMSGIMNGVMLNWTKIDQSTVTFPQTVYYDTFDVHNYYDQVSYHQLYVHVDRTQWHELRDPMDHYIDLSVDAADLNIRESMLRQVWAEAAQAAVDEKIVLDDYDAMACVVFLNGHLIRGWGDRYRSHFYYDDGSGLPINIVLSKEIGLMVLDEQASWQRSAHELGHSLISLPSGLSAPKEAAILDEDLYYSGLVDSADPHNRSAESFDLMGDLDAKPLFSGYYMEQLHFYDAKEILELEWGGHDLPGGCTIVAHGLTGDPAPDRYRLIKIRVSQGLYYYIEVRHAPRSASEGIFDWNIPLAGNNHRIGVVVTCVLTGIMNNNQEMRLITLMHDNVVQAKGAVITDPARGITIKVIDDNISNDTLACLVSVTWGASAGGSIASGASGGGSSAASSDLWITPWDSQWQSPDIWVERGTPNGIYDYGVDQNGMPNGSGDQPLAGHENHIFARIHCDGPLTIAKVTFYTVYPPGVGDNGDWYPINDNDKLTIRGNYYLDTSVFWVPEVGQHTCLKVYIESYSDDEILTNNMAQENVFTFYTPASSVPDPAIIKVAVRNPLKTATNVFLDISGVPEGYAVHFPFSWLKLGPLQERIFDLTVIPTKDYSAYKEMETPLAEVTIKGYVPFVYKNAQRNGVAHGSRMLPIGGITTRVIPRKRTEIVLKLGTKTEGSDVHLRGTIKPALAGEKVLVDLFDGQYQLGVVSAETSGDGIFDAYFKVDGAQKVLIDKADESRLKPDMLSARAFIVASNHLASTESNVVFIPKETHQNL